MEFKDTDKKFWLKVLDDVHSAPITASISEWAKTERFLSTKVTSKPGLYSWENAPYWREPCDCLSPSSHIREIAIMKGTQVLCTTSTIENCIGFTIGVRPTSMLLVSGDKQLIKDFKKIKLDQLIDDSDLRQYIKADTGNLKSRRQGDTAGMLEFQSNGRQGYLRICGSNNPADFQTLPYQIVLLDEVDLYPDSSKRDGDVCALASARAASYGDRAKIIYMSRPQFAHTSKIWIKYKNGDQRKWFIPCPYCKNKQTLVFRETNGGEYPDAKGVKDRNNIIHKPYGISFDAKMCSEGVYSSVGYKCRYCGEIIKDAFQDEMNNQGEWRPTARSRFPSYRSYHFSGLYVKKWWIVVRQFLEAGKDPNKLQVFWNEVLGLPFEDTATGVDSRILHRLRGNRPNNIIPKGALFLVAAADIQGDRIEVEIKAYGDRFLNWGIDHRIFKGDTSCRDDDCWKKLAKIVDEEWTNGRGKTLQIERMLVDSGDGELTDMIYSICEEFGQDEKIMLPLKGFQAAIKTREKFKLVPLKNYETSLVQIYVDLYKNQVSKWMNQEWRAGEDCPDGWVNLPATYSDEYLRQLATEKKKKVRTAGGLTKIVWEQHGRNESWDLNIYCACAADLTIWYISIEELGLKESSPSSVFEFLKEKN